VARLVRDAAGGSLVSATAANNNLGGLSRILFADNGASLTHIGGSNSRGTDRAVIPYLMGRNTGTYNSYPNALLYYDAANGLMPLATNEYVNATAGDVASASFPAVSPDGNDNVRIPYATISDTSLHPLQLPAGDTAINSLFFDGNATNGVIGGGYVQFDVTAGATLTVKSGVVMLSGTASGASQPCVKLTVPTLRFGAGGTGAEGVISYFGNGNVGRWDIYSKLVGDRGLTLHDGNGGGATLSVYGDNSGLAGLMSFSSAADVIQVTHVNGLGSGTNPVYVANGTTLRAAASISGGHSQTAGSLAGGGTVRRGGGSCSLNIGGDGTGGAGDTVTMSSGGRLAPGDTNQPAWLTIRDFGSVALNGGTLAIDLFEPRNTWGGMNPVVYDRLVITGASAPAVTLGGLLSVALHYIPQVGDAFRIVDVSGATLTAGQFGNDVSITPKYGDRRYRFTVLYNSSEAGGDGNDVVVKCAAIILSGTTLVLR